MRPRGQAHARPWWSRSTRSAPGVGEVVLYASGSSARQTQVTKDRPVDATIMAIVDQVEVGGDVTYAKESSSRW